ncbi:MAG: phosphotransferase [Clostridia bacterium]|nr:phosphotransferase [Clostridia bacterium]
MKDFSNVLKNFGFPEDSTMIPWGNGHINDTFRVNDEYLLQRINTNVFKDPKGLMNNIYLVTDFLSKRIVAAGGDPKRETLTIVKTVDGELFFTDDDGKAYRMYLFIDNTLSLDKVEEKEDFYSCGFGFGDFQRQLGEFDASLLTETIVNFHNTLARFETFEKAIADNKSGRRDLVQAEIDFALARKGLVEDIMDRYSRLPLRVTHNDTKLNNVLFDEKTRKPLCVIDLDTVMPGKAANDFGDAVRFGASTAAEDETDLSKVHFDIELYRAFAQGFLAGCGNVLGEEERISLAYGCILMTFECGMRFLTDHLEGDTYFKIHRENHNLDRCRTQFKLVSEMEQQLDKMIEIVK